MLHGEFAGARCNKRSPRWRQAGRIPPSAWKNNSDQNGKEWRVAEKNYLPNTEDFDKEIIWEAGEKHLANDVDV
jgi:hypothetical protein